MLSLVETNQNAPKRYPKKEPIISQAPPCANTQLEWQVARGFWMENAPFALSSMRPVPNPDL